MNFNLREAAKSPDGKTISDRAFCIKGAEEES